MKNIAIFTVLCAITFLLAKVAEYTFEYFYMKHGRIRCNCGRNG